MTFAEFLAALAQQYGDYLLRRRPELVEECALSDIELDWDTEASDRANLDMAYATIEDMISDLRGLLGAVEAIELPKAGQP